MVVLVEVIRKAYLASVVPVIVNSILNEHQVVADIIAFVSKGDFPRSRLGEKQRGKILAGWVTRKMRTIAQFSIRDADGADSQITEVPEERAGPSSLRHGSATMVGSSISNVSAMPEILPLEVEQRYSSISRMHTETSPDNIYENSIMESPPLPQGKMPLNGANPINTQETYHVPQRDDSAMSPSVYSPYESIPSYYNQNPDPDETPRVERSGFSYDRDPPAPRFDSKPTLSSLSEVSRDVSKANARQRDEPYRQASRPNEGVRVREYSWESERNVGGGGLRATNMEDEDEDEDQWPQQAVPQLGVLTGGRHESGSSRSKEMYDGSGYGDAL